MLFFLLMIGHKSQSHILSQLLLLRLELVLSQKVKSQKNGSSILSDNLTENVDKVHTRIYYILKIILS